MDVPSDEFQELRPDMSRWMGCMSLYVMSTGAHTLIPVRMRLWSLRIRPNMMGRRPYSPWSTGHLRVLTVVCEGVWVYNADVAGGCGPAHVGAATNHDVTRPPAGGGAGCHEARGESRTRCHLLTFAEYLLTIVSVRVNGIPFACNCTGQYAGLRTS